MSTRTLADTADSAVWVGWMGLLNDAARMASAAPLERMLRVKAITDTSPPDLTLQRDLTALLAAPLREQQKLIAAALAYREVYEALLESTDPTLHH
jgi:hypothetical protein